MSSHSAKEPLSKDLRLTDQEQTTLYEFCRGYSDEMYSLVRRLARHGLMPDPPGALEPPSSKERVYIEALTTIRQRFRSDPKDLEAAVIALRWAYDIANNALFAAWDGFASPDETPTRLTDAACQEVIADLAAREWVGLTKDDVRMFDNLINARRGAVETTCFDCEMAQRSGQSACAQHVKATSAHAYRCPVTGMDCDNNCAPTRCAIASTT